MPHGAATATRVGSERRPALPTDHRVFAAHTRHAALFIATWDRAYMASDASSTPLWVHTSAHVRSDGFAPQKRRATLFTDPCDRSHSCVIGCAIGTRRCPSVPRSWAGRSVGEALGALSQPTGGAWRCVWVRVLYFAHVASVAPSIRAAVATARCPWCTVAQGGDA